MDLAELEARLFQLRQQEVADNEVLRIAFQAVEDARTAAGIENASRRAEGLLGTFDVDFPGIPDLEEEFPHACQESLEAVDRARNEYNRAKARATRARDARQEVEDDFRALRDKLWEEEVAEHRAGVVHWDRRFHASLAIGHGAAFAAIANHVFDKDTSKLAIKASLAPLTLFALGLLCAGLIPWVLSQKPDTASASKTLVGAWRSRRRASTLAGISAGLFVGAVASAVVGAFVLAFPPENKPVVMPPAASTEGLSRSAPRPLLAPSRLPLPSDETTPAPPFRQGTNALPKDDRTGGR